MEPALGRYAPKSWEHVRTYALAEIEETVVAEVNRSLWLPYWHLRHDQGSEGACVGFGTSMMSAIINTHADYYANPRVIPYTHRYDPWWLWDRAKEHDSFPDTNPGDSNGTTVNAATTVLRNIGHVKVINSVDGRSGGKPNYNYGINANRWALSVDEMRTQISKGVPISIGINWYSSFDLAGVVDKGTLLTPEYWIGTKWAGSYSRLRGGHCVCVHGASDRRQGFKIKNSWGRSYPSVWMPYEVMGRMLGEDGEATVVTDR